MGRRAKGDRGHLGEHWWLVCVREVRCLLGPCVYALAGPWTENPAGYQSLPGAALPLGRVLLVRRAAGFFLGCRRQPNWLASPLLKPQGCIKPASNCWRPQPWAARHQIQQQQIRRPTNRGICGGRGIPAGLSPSQGGRWSAALEQQPQCTHTPTGTGGHPLHNEGQQAPQRTTGRTCSCPDSSPATGCAKPSPHSEKRCEPSRSAARADCCC
jgi:hypothetical protein